MQGGVNFFRGMPGVAARYMSQDSSIADDYYTEGGKAIFRRRSGGPDSYIQDDLTGEQFREWVAWNDPLLPELSRGRPRTGERQSPLFFEYSVNVPKSLSLAAAVDSDVQAALEEALEEAANNIHQFIAGQAVTRRYDRASGLQFFVPAEHVETGTVLHRTSRAGDPHFHLHLMVLPRVYAGGQWSAMLTGGPATDWIPQVHALGEAAIHTNEKLRQALADAGFSYDPTSGEVTDFSPQIVHAFSQRSQQVEANLDELLAQWRVEHPGQEPGATARAQLHQLAWQKGRPEKRMEPIGVEDWRAELAALGWKKPEPKGGREAVPEPMSREEIVDVALAQLTAGYHTFSVKQLRAKILELLTKHQGGSLEELLAETAELTGKALDDSVCIVDKEQQANAEIAGVKAWTTRAVIECEYEVRDGLNKRATAPLWPGTNKEKAIDEAQKEMGLVLSEEQRKAARALAMNGGLAVIEGAAGAGKTTMLRAGSAAVKADGGNVFVLAPTRKAAGVVKSETGLQATTIEAFVRQMGWSWDENGRWTKGEARKPIRLSKKDVFVVDEAGMIGQDQMRALLDSIGPARLVLVGDREQLRPVGRGGAFKIAAELSEPVSLRGVRRFSDPKWAAISLDIREGKATTVPYLAKKAVKAEDHEAALDAIAADTWADLDAGKKAVAVAATNADAQAINKRIQAARLEALPKWRRPRSGFTRPDGQTIYVGDTVATRENDRDLGVCNREQWLVKRTDRHGLLLQDVNNRRRRVFVPNEYAAENVELAWAVTDYGAQGMTTTSSRVLVTDQTSWAGVYVGLTRGKESNLLYGVEGALADQLEAARGRKDPESLAQAAERAAEKLDPYLPYQPPAPKPKSPAKKLPYKVKVLADGSELRTYTKGGQAHRVGGAAQEVWRDGRLVAETWWVQGQPVPSQRPQGKVLPLVQDYERAVSQSVGRPVAVAAEQPVPVPVAPAQPTTLNL